MAEQRIDGRVHHRRYATAETIAELLKPGRARAERTFAGAATYNIMTDEWTEWHAVSEDDPRLNTVEHLE